MTEDIHLSYRGPTHRSRQTEGMRYRIGCRKHGELNVECSTQKTNGFIADAETYEDAREIAIAHPHSVEISFWEDGETVISPDFQKDLLAQTRS